MQGSNWLEKKELGECQIHKGNHLEWVCLEKSCEKRIFCQFCVIYDHKNIHQSFSHVSQLLQDPLISIQKLDVVTSELETLKPMKTMKYRRTKRPNWTT